MTLIRLMLLTLFLCHSASAVPYTYDVRKTDNHVIHIVTLNLQSYDMKVVKAHDQVFGRETVASMALRHDADIAINGGFFEIGQHKDGMPSGTLIIDGNIFSLKPKEQACLVQNLTEISIAPCGTSLHVILGKKKITVNKVNQFADAADIVLYTNTWGKNTLTPFKNRYEIICDENYKIIKSIPHGNNSIPSEGFVLSFPESYKMKDLKNIKSLTFENLPTKQNLSMISGIPQLVKDGKIIPDILKKQMSFYTLPHARTAIGIKPNGDIVIIVAEHAYKKDLQKITLGEVKNLIFNNKLKTIIQTKKMPNNLTLDDLKTIVKKEFTDINGVIGLTLIELAQLMIDLGCDSALNLDGGGSSTLWLDGKVINHAIGDEDENMGQSQVRPVSDAIVFRKKDK